MAIKHFRRNVIFKKAIAELLTDIAKHEQKSVSCVIEELVLEALSYREDISFSFPAETRGIKSAKRVKAHLSVEP